MRIYWSLRSVPELAAVPAPELKKLIEEAREDAAVRKASGIAMGVLAFCVAFGSSGGGSLLHSGIWGAAIGGGIGGFLYSQIQMRALVRYLRGRLESAEFPQQEAVLGSREEFEHVLAKVPDGLPEEHERLVRDEQP